MTTTFSGGGKKVKLDTISTDSPLLDLRITEHIIGFAQALLKRYNLLHAETIEQVRQIDREFGYDYDWDSMNADEYNRLIDESSKDEDYMQEIERIGGESNGVLRCIEILHELVDAEVKDREQYTLDKK